MSKLRILVSYPYFDQGISDLVQERHDDIELLIDSGAFTAFKQNKPIELKEYTAFIHSLPFKPFGYFMLDVIGDPGATRKNYQAMLKDGLKPIPVFTRGENPRQLESYYERSKIVAIGGLAGTIGNKAFVRGIMPKVKKRKVHWLGFMNQDFIAKYKPYSCDTANWHYAARFANIHLYYGRGRWIKVFKKDFQKRPSRLIMDIFEKYEEDPKRLAWMDEWRNSMRGDCLLEQMTFKSWSWWQMDIYKQYRVRAFLASPARLQIVEVLKAHKFWKNKLNIPEES